MYIYTLIDKISRMENNSKTFFSKVKTYISDIVSLSDHIDTDKASQYIRSNVDFKGPNAYILAFAIIVASVGLNTNSIAVIIGAMLISPLMGPIFGIGYGLGTNDTSFLKKSFKNLLKKSFKNLIVMVVISVLASTVYFLVSPLELENPTELLTRTNPTIYDVFIALFGGSAGIIEISRKDKGTVISGVAIATALMPPLCTAGFGLATGSLKYFAGALYLFSINSIFIAIATLLAVKYLKFPMATFTDPAKQKRVSRWIAALVIIIIIPSVYSAVIMIRENNFSHTAKEFIAANKELSRSYIYDHSIDFRAKPPKIELFIAGEALSNEELNLVYKSAHEFGFTDDQIIISQNAATDQREMTDRVHLREKRPGDPQAGADNRHHAERAAELQDKGTALRADNQRAAGPVSRPDQRDHDPRLLHQPGFARQETGRDTCNPECRKAHIRRECGETTEMADCKAGF